jgi:hypothetical protein
MSIEKEDDNDLLLGIYIQLARIYDVLLLTLDAEEAEKIMLAHEQGRVIGSRPAIEYTEKPADGELNT